MKCIKYTEIQSVVELFVYSCIRACDIRVLLPSLEFIHLFVDSIIHSFSQSLILYLIFKFSRSVRDILILVLFNRVRATKCYRSPVYSFRAFIRSFKKLFLLPFIKH